MWNGKHYKCLRCGEIYSENIRTCPCCNALCIEIPPSISAVALAVVQNVNVLSVGGNELLPSHVASLTEEQQAVVDIVSGRHFVLAPPGSGKTEMLTQRVLAAMRAGINVDRMFCVTFTTRAGVEMRERVIAAVSRDERLKGKSVPDIGTIHRFCNRLLAANGLLGDRKVVDEITQRELMEDIWVQLKKELVERLQSALLRENSTASQLIQLDPDEKCVRDIVSVLNGFQEKRLSGQHESDYYRVLIKSIRDCEEYYGKKCRSIFSELVMGTTYLYRQKVGIPDRLLRPIPRPLIPLRDNGLLPAIARAYAKIKDVYEVLCFDDLITQTYKALRDGTALKSESRFDWIQIDEAQDFNALQWEIIRMVSRDDAASVYFGDTDQMIFSFMGNSPELLARAASSCEVHHVRKNFRSTSYLLDILTRYSLRVLRSKTPFLPVPCSHTTKKGELLCQPMSLGECVKVAMGWLDKKYADNVALLVRANKDADSLEQLIEQQIKETGSDIKYVKVSGVEVFEMPAMRDFMAFCSLLNKSESLMDWARMFSRFGKDTSIGKPISAHIARRLVKVLRDTGISFDEFFSENGFDEGKIRAKVSESWQVDVLRRVHLQFSPLWNDASMLLKEVVPYRAFFNLFIESCRRQGLFSQWDLATKKELDTLQQNARAPLAEWEVYEYFSMRTDKFLKYLETKDAINDAQNPSCANMKFGDRLKKEWAKVLRLREADLIVGDEKLVISTIHKAKGRQFDGVVIPRCNKDVYPGNTDGRLFDLVKSWKNRDEAARLLYVGLSRAKRHLAIGWDCERERSPFLDEIMGCFKSGFLDFFTSKSPSDWLYQYNEVLEAAAEKRCCKPVLEKLFSTSSTGQPTDEILKRMAIRAMRYSDDVEWRDCVFGEILTTVPREPQQYDVYVEVLRSIGEMRLPSFADKLRRGFLRTYASPMRDGVHYTYLGCYGRLVEKTNVSLEAALGGQNGLPLKNMVLEAAGTVTDQATDSEYHLGIEDALFDENCDVRREAARLLYMLTGDARYTKYDGSETDWDRLRDQLNPERIKVLNWLIKKVEDGPWKRHLCELVSAFGKKK